MSPDTLYNAAPVEQPLQAAPPRSLAVLGIALLQGVGFWLFPKAPFVPLLALLLVLPTVFYCTERYLPQRPWRPVLVFFLFWLGMAAYAWRLDDSASPGLAGGINTALFLLFSFIALPFVQTWFELGRLRASELSARMNRNVTLLMLGGLALLPVCLVLAFGLGNIRWDSLTLDDQFTTWNPLTPFGFVCLIAPLTFAGALNWAQRDPGLSAGGPAADSAVLPFLRKTIGAISGWVALTSALGMAGILLSALLSGDAPQETDGLSLFGRLVPPAFFWTSVSLCVREGSWKAKPRALRAGLKAGVPLFALYMIWLTATAFSLPEPLTYEAARSLWSWRTLGLAVLLLAALGQTFVLIRRQWPARAAAVNAGVHLGILGLIILCRLPWADPVRYEAAAKARFLVDHPDQAPNWVLRGYGRDYGRYGPQELDKALAAIGMERERWESIRKNAMALGNDFDPTLSEEDKKTALSRRLRALSDLPRYPSDSALPEDLLDWLGDPDRENNVGNVDNFLFSKADRAVAVEDMDGDGQEEVVLLDYGRQRALVLKWQETWSVAGYYQLPPEASSDLPVGRSPGRWSDLTLGGTPVPFTPY